RCQCGFRDGSFRRRLASSKVQSNHYCHRGKPRGNAYDGASHESLPCPCESKPPDFRRGNREMKCEVHHTSRSKWHLYSVPDRRGAGAKIKPRTVPGLKVEWKEKV